MKANPKYDLYGYLEFFPVDIGFVTPVFIKENSYYIETETNNYTFDLITLPNEYLKFITREKKQINLKFGKSNECYYALKYFDNIYFGTGITLVDTIKKLIREEKRTFSRFPFTQKIITDFLDEYEPKLISSKTKTAIKKVLKAVTKTITKNSGKISIMIVDSHTLIRETWSYLLGRNEDLDIIAETGDGQHAIELARDHHPNIVLLEINMEPLNGFDILKMIRKLSPGSKVIAVTMHAQPAYAKKMLRLGARGYVTKNSPRKEMLDAIHQVIAGNVYICQAVKNIMSDQMMTEDEEGHELNKLSDREMEVINLIRNGLSSKDIADKLAISIKTVEIHRHNILKKLKVENTASLINYINASGL